MKKNKQTTTFALGEGGFFDRRGGTIRLFSIMNIILYN